MPATMRGNWGAITARMITPTMTVAN